MMNFRSPAALALNSVLIAVIGFGAASAALARPPVGALPARPGQAQQAYVDYADLDLASAAGRGVFDKRVRQAVGIACGPTSIYRPACVRHALKVSRPQMTAAIEQAERQSLALAIHRR